MKLGFLIIVTLIMVFLTIWAQARFFGVTIKEYLKFRNLNYYDYFYNFINLIFLFILYSVIIGAIYCSIMK
jgi:hypothetical protein